MKHALPVLVACLLFSAPIMVYGDCGQKHARHKGKKVIAAQDAPQAIGPYSQAIQAGPMLFVSGSLGMDPATGKIVDGGVAAETEQALNNLGAILKAAGASFDDIVKTTIFLTEIGDFKTVNEIYAKRFASAPPARSTVAVKELPRSGKVEIEAIAIVPICKPAK